MAKNKIKRSLGAICDPHPSKAEEKELWEYFDSQCAYCGVSIERDSRTGHLDHLVPISEGGTNSIFNHVLSCAKCNGDEKREEEWESFLKSKSVSLDVYEQRKNRISQWLQRAPKGVNEPDIVAVRASIINKALADFDGAVARMRELRDRCT
ncbi:HNH endonuclease [Halioglobus pacificus]|nr:HNH endonuclease signature motif containing protein [Halioglobus pacificus]